MSDQPLDVSVEIMPPENAALQALESASISMQVRTAKEFPRKIAEVKAKMMSMATLDEETAESCFYTLRRKGKDGEVKIIQGPSIRLAEIAAACYGNIRAGAMVVSNNGKVIVSRGMCWDMENNVAFSMESSRRITTKSGATFGEDMQVVTANAGNAIALRNAITKVVPLILIKPVLDAAKRVAVGDVRSLSIKRGKVIARLKAIGASQDSILAAVDCSTVDEVTIDKLEILIGLGTALRDGDTSVEEAFPAVGGKLHSRGVAKEPEGTQAAPEAAAPPSGTPPPTDAPEPKAAPENVTGPHITPQMRLVNVVTEAGFEFAHLIAFLVEGGHLVDPVGTPDGIPAQLAERMYKARKGLIDGLKKANPRYD